MSTTEFQSFHYFQEDVGDVKLDGYTSNGSITTNPFFIKNMTEGSIQVYAPATGSPNGTLQAQFSNTLERNKNGTVAPNDDPDNWIWSNVPEPPDTSYTVAGAVNQFWSFGGPNNKLSGRWVRLVYTRVSGSITITASMQAKH